MRHSYVDMHCDTLLRGLYENETSIYDGAGMQSLKQMINAKQLAQFYAIFFPPKMNPEDMPEGYPPLPSDEEIFERLRNQLYSQVEIHSDQVGIAHNYQEIMNNKKKGMSSAILTIEDGRMIDEDMKKLYYIYKKGVRAIALTWNYENCFGYPNSNNIEIMQKGLKEFGKEAITEMNNLGILIDVSHLSDGGFYDVAQISDKPFIASHSNCREITPHSRNLTDDMIRILAEKGGIAGINFGPDFASRISGTNITRITDLADHIEHFIDIGGEDCVGLGTDFDGVEGNLEIDHPDKMELLFDELVKRGISERVIDKVASDNVLRIIKEAMK